MDEKLILQQIANCIIDGDTIKIKDAVTEGLRAMIPAQTILEDGLMAGMSVIGRQFRDNDVYVPEVIMAAQAMKIALHHLKPFLADRFLGNKGKVVIGTVPFDLHDLGKIVVSVMLEGAGFSVVDLGVDVPVQRFVEAVNKERPDILAISCTLTTTLTYLKEVVEAVRKTEAGKGLNILVGGLSVTPRFAQSINADAYGVDANLAVMIAQAMVRQ
ncbi:MAG TPA: cobalamin-binding protein [Syntrophaceticus sp.]|nr:cobalamin-binding protein [Syntrophaceticus sp.]